MSKFVAGDMIECVDASYSEGKLIEGLVYEVERSWDCGGSEFLDLVGSPGSWAPERFKPATVTYSNASATLPSPYLTEPLPPISTACHGTEAKVTYTYESEAPIGTVITFDPANGPPVFVETPKADESARRKAMPVCTGVLDYFPAALLEVSKLSKFGGDKHAPGEPLHHARGRSADHPDALVRHLLERGTIDPDSGLSHTVGVAWRALAMLQEELEAAGAPLARGAKK